MLEIRNLNKTYITKGAPPVHALVDVSVKLEHTGMVFVLGKSGSGKSTFLNVVGGLDKYDSGEIIIKGKSSREFKGSDFDSYRNTYLGFVFQEYNLINEFSVGRNIALAMELQSRKAGPQEIGEILRLVDLDGLADRMPMQISGGQRQRVAIARALIKNPEIIMADEPTGALDSNTGAAIFSTLQNLSRTRLVLIVSHDREFAERYGDRIIEFSDGRIVSDVIKSGEGFTEVQDLGDAKRVEEIIEASKKAGLSGQHMRILVKLLEEKRKEAASGGGGGGRRGVFVPTREEMLNMSGGGSAFKLIKSKLPQRDALKMASSSMRHKRVRLFFSIFLSVIAVTLFGFSNVVGQFGVQEIAKSLMRDYGYNHMIVTKGLDKESVFSYGGSNLAFNDEDRQKMAEITDGGVAEFISLNAPLPTDFYATLDKKYNEDYFDSYINGLVLTDDFAKMGLEVPEVYGRYPEADNEILITNYMAEIFMAYGMTYYEGIQEKTFKPQKINEVLSYSFYFQHYSALEMKIVGIINFPIERYKDLKLTETKNNVSNTLRDEFRERKEFEISFLYARPGLVDLLYGGYSGYSSYHMDFGLDDLVPKPDPNGYMYYTNIYGTDMSSFKRNNYSYNYLGADGSSVMPELKKGEVIINLSQYLSVKGRMAGKWDTGTDEYFLDRDELQAQANQIGLFGEKRTISSYHGDLAYRDVFYEFYSGDFEVVGVVSTGGYYYDSCIGIFNDEEYYDMTKEGISQTLMVYLKDQRAVNSFVDNFVGEFDSGTKGVLKIYTFAAPFANNIYNVSMVFKVLSVVFFWMSIVLCVFAALLLLNFISASVNLKKKEIGILRALGARKIDVVSIFLWEGIIIGLIVLAVSAVLVFGTVVLFNNLIGTLINMPLTMLVFGLLPLFYMALICFATIAVASILPTRRVAALKPMDAIRSI